MATEEKKVVEVSEKATTVKAKKTTKAKATKSAAKATKVTEVKAEAETSVKEEVKATGAEKVIATADKEAAKAPIKDEAAAPVKELKPTLKDFEIVKNPIITEKSTEAIKNQNKYTFLVENDANKVAIRNAIERIYKVHVTGISIVNIPEKKIKSRSRYKGVRSGYKKAIVSLREGETINLFKE
jgi:large subunit ribosomal protein L23